MANFIKPPGIEDIFPDKITLWDFVLNTARSEFTKYNFKEIIIPIMEYTDVFSRGLGTETDIVSKEMFTFTDRGDRSLTLRPEGTACVVRAYVENGEYNRLSSCKLFYAGPMFRAERPQKGRLRQFNQFGAEFFGSSNAYYDYEVIAMMNSISKKLGIESYTLLINSIGCPKCREAYISDLKKFYSSQTARLCEDCKKRLDKNPLRLLDCKNESCKALKSEAPLISAYLCDDCKSHHAQLKDYLAAADVAYTEDAHLVRGLDYYTKTTFEFVSGALGAQNAFAAGGRYDNLVELFGGKPTPAVGFAAGIERIMLLLEGKALTARALDVYIIHSGDTALNKAVNIANMLRDNNISVDIDPDSKGFKAQFKKADRENAKCSIIIGEDEVKTNSISIKLMTSGEQIKLEDNKLLEYITSKLKS